MIAIYSSLLCSSSFSFAIYGYCFCGLDVDILHHCMFDFCWSLGWHGFLLLSYILFFLILLESNMTLFHFCCETSENHIPGSYVNLLSLSLDLQAHWQPMKWVAFNGSFGLFILTQLMLLFSFATSLLLSPFMGPWSWSSLHFNTWKNCFRWLRPSSSPPSSLGSVDAFTSVSTIRCGSVRIPFTKW